MSRPLPAGLYAMADAAWGDPVEVGSALFEAGCRVVQLRAKGWDPAPRLRAARRLVAVAEAHGALLVVNDDLEVAVRAGAHGLHLGQDDGPLDAARQRLGPGPLLGRSTHDLDQLRRAAQEGADYCGFGPVYPTRTKADASPTVGVALLAQAVAASPVPLVAIGGIDRQRLSAVIQTGVHAWAVVSDLLAAWPEGKDALARRVQALDPTRSRREKGA